MEKRFLIDANLIRDMLSVSSLKALLSMECSFCTMDGVLSELKKIVVPEIFDRIRNFNKLNNVCLDGSSTDEVFTFYDSLSNKLTYAEVVLIFYAKKNDCVILSSDWNFLNIAKQHVPKAYNLLQVFEGMVRKNVLDYSQAAECLEAILETNHCLPKEECMSVLKKWKSK